MSLERPLQFFPGARVMCVARNQQELEKVGLDYAVGDLGNLEAELGRTAAAPQPGGA